MSENGVAFIAKKEPGDQCVNYGGAVARDLVMQKQYSCAKVRVEVPLTVTGFRGVTKLSFVMF